MPKTTYVWDELSDNVIEEYEDGVLSASYTHEPGLYGNLLSQNRNGVTSYYHYDGRGDTVAITDDSGNVTDTKEYDAWGNLTASTGGTVTPYMFGGRNGYQTGSHGLYIRARVYRPSDSRWLSMDPIGWHRDVGGDFCFVINSPVNETDPSGLIIASKVSSGYLEPKVTPCSVLHGASYWMNWSLSLDKPARCDGWWVQLLFVRLRYQNCPVQLPFLENDCCRVPDRASVEIVSMEATRVAKGTSRIVTDRWAFNRMPGVLQSTLDYCGVDEKRGESRFYCDPSEAGREIDRWPNDGPGASPSHPSQSIGSIDLLPTWWWNTGAAEEVEKNPRLVKFEFNCCDASPCCKQGPFAKLSIRLSGTNNLPTVPSEL